ncbi:phenylalanine--tRNA ligase subunit alpha [Candidatus Falkowbacteria bacterium]|nr:phenylalanine--tRNA ligase subunit alpha [Candidatus Falkowbacteria bacterium]
MTMKEKISQLKKEAIHEIKSSDTFDSLKKLEKKYLGRKGELTDVLKGLKDLGKDARKDAGQFANQAKQELEQALKETQVSLEQVTGVKIVTKNDWVDVTMPSKLSLGNLHPLSRVQYELEDIFSSLGFMILDGPELESDYYNFESLNIPKDHPARDIQDTFYIKGKKDQVLRTHTSNLQVRAMQEYGAPIRAIFPGRCFRFDATDASHDATFNQVEGLMIDKNISIANFKAIVDSFLSEIFNRKIKTRLRPGYFPFVEPGFEVDLPCEICKGRGCKVCKNSGWVEFMGAGMVHPIVLKNGGVDPKKYTGFAFGFGITRLTMMKYKINDIRHFLGSDLRFLKQF